MAEKESHSKRQEPYKNQNVATNQFKRTLEKIAS